MTMSAELARIQRRFYELIVAPEGVRAGVAALGLGSREVEEMITGDARLSAVERLDLYAHMYFFRLRDILVTDYPKVVTVLGDERFHNLCVDYLHACPPRSASVRELGDQLPGFLSKNALAKERPWLADLARLERARLEIFDGFADAQTTTLETVRSISPEELATLPLKWIPARMVIECDYDIAALWRELEDGRSIVDRRPLRETRAIQVWRQGVSVYHRTLDDDERDVLPRIGRGEPFGLVCEHLAALHGDEAAARRAFELLARWVVDGLLAG